MPNPSPGLRGVIHGKTIELDREPGLPDGQEVEVTVTVLRAPDHGEGLPAGEGLQRSFGAWAEDAVELDEYLEWSRRQRKIGRPELEP
jgi:hypothetical protein